jgi:vacuolar-type H+-ATPase subunit H
MNSDSARSPAREALGKVREAEERAKAIIREAQERTAVQIIKEAAAAAEKTKQQALARAREEAEAYKKGRVEKALKGADGIRAEAERELEDLRRRAGAAFDKAVQQVALKVKEILEKGLV